MDGEQKSSAVDDAVDEEEEDEELENVEPVEEEEEATPDDEEDEEEEEEEDDGVDNGRQNESSGPACPSGQTHASRVALYVEFPWQDGTQSGMLRDDWNTELETHVQLRPFEVGDPNRPQRDTVQFPVEGSAEKTPKSEQSHRSVVVLYSPERPQRGN